MKHMAEIRINVRTTEEIKRGLEITAKLRGLTVSSLINSLAVKAIREEKQIEPQAFAEIDKSNQAEESAILSSTDQREEEREPSFIAVNLPVTAQANKSQSEDEKLHRREG